jgi:hypothetical protein
MHQDTINSRMSLKFLDAPYYAKIRARDGDLKKTSSLRRPATQHAAPLFASQVRERCRPRPRSSFTSPIVVQSRS